MTKTSDKKVPTTWISLFEGSIKLCCSDETAACTESFGSISLNYLYPLVKKGNQAAINFVLAYSALVESDGADASGLKEYQDQIKDKKKKIATFNIRYKNLLKKHPINWIY